jgi:hypothetical protein
MGVQSFSAALFGIPNVKAISILLHDLIDEMKYSEPQEPMEDEFICHSQGAGGMGL